MADKEVADLTSGGAAASGDLIHAVRSGNSRKVTLGDAAGKSTGTASGSVAAGDDDRFNVAVGQCRLSKVSANLVLSPFNGNKIRINGAVEVIPDAGVSLAATGLTPGTVYNIYAYMNSGTMTLEASATGHAVSTTAGNKGTRIKSGDDTRTLVGKAECVTGPAWEDSASNIGVISWFNRRAKAISSSLATTQNVTATSFTEVSSTLRLKFLTWGEEAPIVACGGGWAVGGAATGFARINFDGSVNGGTPSITSVTNTAPCSIVEETTVPSEGGHYATLVGYRSGGTNVQFFSAATGADYPITLQTRISG